MSAKLLHSDETLLEIICAEREGRWHSSSVAKKAQTELNKRVPTLALAVYRDENISGHYCRQLQDRHRSHATNVSGAHSQIHA